MKQVFVNLLLLLTTVAAQSQSAPIGSWADYFPYDKAFAVAEGTNHIMCVTPSAAQVYIKEDNSIDRISKANGLSEINLTAMAYDATTGLFVIGYASGNIDLVNDVELEITNLSDIKRSSITANKTINHIMCFNGYAYLSTGFGIVVLNLAAKEVKDTYYLGPGNSYMNINGTIVGNDTIYATADNGLYRAWASNPFLNVATAWTKDLSLPAWLENTKLKQPFFVGGKLFVVRELPGYNQDTSYVRNGASWIVNPYFNGEVYTMWSNGAMIVMAGSTNATRFDNNFTYIEHIFDYTIPGPVDIRAACYSVSLANFIIADHFHGMIRCPNSFNTTLLRLSGPVSLASRRVAAGKNYVWVAPGTVLGTIYANTFNKDYISTSTDYLWSVIDETNQSIIHTDSLYDIVNIKVDPNDETHVFASAFSAKGLVEIKSGQIVALYDETNSALQDHPAQKGYCGIDGMDFDKDGHLWMANSFSTTPVVVRKSDGTWKAFNCGSNMSGRILGDMVCSRENGYKYIALPTNGQGNGGLFVYNDNETPDDATDDNYKLLTTSEGNGALPSADVRSVTEDLDGEIWIGTTQGIAIIYSPENIFASGANFDAQQILITQDGNVQILLETEIVSDIAIDGGNRKWIATESSGVFLFSQDGVQQIFHFTQENSPLPSNMIYDIEINGETGEVYFATAGGIVAYRSEATDGRLKMDDVYVYPNPVEPGYTGLIAVNGLGRDSDIKITDVSGNVVFMTKSLGGQAVWDGNTLEGNRVKPGIYLVMCSNKSGKQRVAAKLLILE